MPPVHRIPHPEQLRATALRDSFIAEHNARRIKFSGYNLSRMLRLTGERPARIALARRILGDLGLSHDGHWLSCAGVFDHPDFWRGAIGLACPGRSPATHTTFTRMNTR